MLKQYVNDKVETLSKKVDGINAKLSETEFSREADTSQVSAANRTHTIPGNSSYASVVNGGKKIVLLSDSMCGRMNMKRLDESLENKTIYRRHFPGATPDDIYHYCTRTLSLDQPDIAVLHVGTNKVKHQDPFEIAESIVNIVDLCRDYGCNQIFISGVVYRPDAAARVTELNNILYQWSFRHGYTFIFNDNIKEDCLDRGKLHLTTRGSARLSSNFRRVLNKPYV